MSAMAWVSGTTLASAVRAAGRAPIGNSDPAKKNGTMAMPGTAAVKSSTLPTLLAIVSATPYIATASAAAAPRNQARPVADTSSSAPRSTDAPMSTATWSAVVARATARLASTSSGRLTGAASRSRRAPPSRSTTAPMPANIALSGMSRPAMPTAVKLM
jgi:hypothetical protein